MAVVPIAGMNDITRHARDPASSPLRSVPNTECPHDTESDTSCYSLCFARGARPFNTVAHNCSQGSMGLSAFRIVIWKA